jgi:hypothetical protein
MWFVLWVIATITTVYEGNAVFHRRAAHALARQAAACQCACFELRCFDAEVDLRSVLADGEREVHSPPYALPFICLAPGDPDPVGRQRTIQAQVADQIARINGFREGR